MRTLVEVTKDITESTGQDWESVVKPLYDERTVIIKHDRDEWEDNNYFVLIDCPSHITHKVKLFIFPHRYAGIWECDEDEESISDSCLHFDRVVEDIEDEEGKHSHMYVCALCLVALEGDPDD